MALANIQNRLDELEPNETLPLEKGDYAPCVINKPVTLLCDGSTFWTDGSAPAIVIRSPNVTIKDANLRCSACPEHVVLSVEANCHPLLHNLRIHGNAVGVDSNPTEWKIPSQINIGEVSPAHPGQILELGVPERSQIVCRISGVSINPSALEPGINRVKLEIRDAMPGSMLIGEIEILSGVLTRLIPLFARISTGVVSTQDTVATMLYGISPTEKERYQKLLVGGGAKMNIQPAVHREKTSADVTIPSEIKPTSRKPKKAHRSTDIKAKTSFFWGDTTSSAPTSLEDDKSTRLGGAFTVGTSQRRLSVYFLVGTSQSIAGDLIDSINGGINALHSELMNDSPTFESTWLSVISFDRNARQVVPLTALSSFTPPILSIAEGRALGSALRLLTELLKKDAAHPSNPQTSDWKPMIFLLIDGPPSDSWEDAASDLKSQFDPLIVAIACGDADISLLKSITESVHELKNMSPNDFSMLFKWLNNSSQPIKERLEKSKKQISITSPEAHPVIGEIFSKDLVNTSINQENPFTSQPVHTNCSSNSNTISGNSQQLSNLFKD